MIFKNAKRPVLILGWGIHLAHAEKEAHDFAQRTGVPVVATWGAADLFNWDHPLYVGTFGTHGTRPANWAVQNADIVLSVGSRLDTKATGSPASDFARNAQVTMVDIDQAEIDKFKRLGREVTGIRMDAKQFLQAESNRPVECPQWIDRIAKWKRDYPIVLPEYHKQADNPYVFIDKLSDMVRADDTIVSDTGCPVGWMAQAFRFKGQRFYHAWNNTPMGYGLPAAIGAAFATGGRVILVTGDGGLSVNVTEMATLARHQLPVKIILFNNRGHAMCRQTQRTWMDGTYPSTSYEGGLAMPDFEAVARAYEIEVGYENPAWGIEAMLRCSGPGLYQFNVGLDHQIVPQVRAGQPLENADPQLSPEELAEAMNVSS